jgi:hypothetical protein
MYYNIPRPVANAVFIYVHCCLGDDVSAMKLTSKIGFGHLFEIRIVPSWPEDIRIFSSGY